MRSLLVVFPLVLLAVTGLVLWMSRGIQTPEITEPSVIRLPGVTTSSAAPSLPLTVVSWNVSWGYGWGSEGAGGAKPEAHFERTIARMGEVLKSLDADIVLLQELDFDSTRSHHVDQAERLAQLAGLPYVTKALSWDKRWVPFPYWPPSAHFGTVRSGGAILSRFPLGATRVETVEKPSDQAFLYRLFYLFRYHQEATADTPWGEVSILNTHVDAFHRENRVAHARKIAARLNETLTPLAIVGGDLNTVPAEAERRSAYPDEPKTSHVDDPTLELLRGVPGLVDAVPGPVYAADEAKFFTFPAHEPNRMLDHLLVGAGWKVERAWVPRELSEEALSDHLPLVLRLVPVGTP